MIRIGIVGAENSHSAAIGKTVNIARKVPGVSVSAIWGETEEFAAKAAKAGGIPTIVKHPSDLIGLADAVVIDHRHAKFHLPAARAFLKARLPMFIDKPFCYRLAEGKRFLAEAARLKAPVTSFSALPHQQSFAALHAQLKKAGPIRAVSTIGPCDLASPWGGIFFYGIHQVDMIVELLGLDASAVQVVRAPNGKDATASIFFDSGAVASMNCLADFKGGFHLAGVTDQATVAGKIVFDADAYLTGIRRFCRMFKTGQEPLGHERILAPVAVLEALEKSVNSGKLVKIKQ